jgi:hypothetical protein
VKTAAKLFLGSWVLWSVYQIIRLATDYDWTTSGVHAYNYGAAIGSPLLVSIGAWLAWSLYRRPSRSKSGWFRVLCLILAWKFWIGAILFSMNPNLGGYSFGEAVAFWWSRWTSSFRIALPVLLPLPLLAVSLLYWPRYCGKRKAAMADPVPEESPQVAK